MQRALHFFVLKQRNEAKKIQALRFASGSDAASLACQPNSDCVLKQGLPLRDSRICAFGRFTMAIPLRTGHRTKFSEFFREFPSFSVP